MSKDFNWGKKISLKEIAQFYEERISELDGKYFWLTREVPKLTEKFKARLDSLEQRANDLENMMRETKISLSEKESELHETFKNQRAFALELHNCTLNSADELANAYEDIIAALQEQNDHFVKVVATLKTEYMIFVAANEYATKKGISIRQVDTSSQEFQQELSMLIEWLGGIHTSELLESSLKNTFLLEYQDIIESHPQLLRNPFRIASLKIKDEFERLMGSIKTEGDQE